MNIPYHKPMFFKKEKQPEPFRFDFSPTVVEIEGQPKTIDLAISEVANREESPLPKKPSRVVAIAKPIKPAIVSVGLLPVKPLEISAVREVNKPAFISAEATPAKPQTASVIADPIAPLDVTANSMPYAPTESSVSATPKKPESASFASSPKQPLEITVGGIPVAPTESSVSATPKKPESASFGYLPYAPTEVNASFIPYAPTEVSVEANPKKPESASFDYIPYAPTAISGGVIPDVPLEISAGVIPNVPSEVSVLGAPAKPSLAFAFEPFVVEIMETEAEITARSGDTMPGTVAFGTDTKKLYVFNELGLDAWGAFAEDGFFRTSAYVPMKSARFDGHPTNDYGIATNINRLNGNTWTKESPTTMSGFFKFTGWGGDPSPFGTSGLHPGTTWNPARGSYSDGFHVNSSGRAYMWFGGGQRWITKDSVALYLVQNTWYHFAYTHDGSTLRCFLNGDEVFPSTPNQTSRRIATPQIYVSKGRWNQSMYGMVDQVAFWDSVLDQTTIQSIASGDRNTTLTNNPLAYYSMDTESNNAVPDTSGNSQPDMYMIQDNASDADLVEEEPN